MWKQKTVLMSLSRQDADYELLMKPIKPLKRKIVLFTDFWLYWVSVPDCGGRDSSPVAAGRLLTALASPVRVCGLQGAQALVVLAPGPRGQAQ